MERSQVGIVIPALNESATISAVVAAVARHGIPIVVDDGSTDDTGILAISAGAIVVTHECNRGYDQALNSGFQKAAALGCQVIVTLDADGQHDPSLIDKFVNGIESGADLVLGVRSRKQRLAEHVFALFTRLRFGIDDPLCGLKAYRTALFNAHGCFDSYGSIGTELMLFAAKRRMNIRQVPFQVRERQGESRFGAVFWGNLRIFRAMLLAAKHVR